MRMLLDVTFPHEQFNALVKNGTVDHKLEQIMGDIKPEAVYFVEDEGERTAISEGD